MSNRESNSNPSSLKAVFLRWSRRTFLTAAMQIHSKPKEMLRKEPIRNAINLLGFLEIKKLRVWKFRESRPNHIIRSPQNLKNLEKEEHRRRRNAKTGMSLVRKGQNRTHSTFTKDRLASAGQFHHFLWITLDERRFRPWYNQRSTCR